MCELFEADIQKHLLALGREQHQVEQLEKAQGDPTKSYKELVELLKKAPKDVAEELNKEEGLLAKILDFSKATHAKLCIPTIEELSH